MRFVRKILTRKLSDEGKGKFKPIFSFLNYSLYTVIVLLALQNAGVNLNALLAASAALLVGVGFALQTFFQDIISGIFILIDQTVHVGDIIELDGKVGRVENITLRTTRAVTRDNKVLVIPNHKYLTTTLFNWTENNKVTGESINVSVAYETDIEKFKKIIIEVAVQHPDVIKTKDPILLFQDFGESSLDFTLIVFTENAFKGGIIKSDIRFAIEQALRLNNIEIPFPQRVIHSSK
tara:strand:- start:164 stop:871 length:708 start_codon:yes stop_codon:yes gene_type:complete